MTDSHPCGDLLPHLVDQSLEVRHHGVALLTADPSDVSLKPLTGSVVCLICVKDIHHVADLQELALHILLDDFSASFSNSAS